MDLLITDIYGLIDLEDLCPPSTVIEYCFGVDFAGFVYS